jgi:hypothetical protein
MFGYMKQNEYKNIKDKYAQLEDTYILNYFSTILHSSMFLMFIWYKHLICSNWPFPAQNRDGNL